MRFHSSLPSTTINRTNNRCNKSQSHSDASCTTFFLQIMTTYSSSSACTLRTRSINCKKFLVHRHKTSDVIHETTSQLTFFANHESDYCCSNGAALVTEIFHTIRISPDDGFTTLLLKTPSVPS